jgi:hypothetical protein
MSAEPGAPAETPAKIKIEKGVPIPGRSSPYDELAEAMKTMEIDDSFLYRVKYPERFRTAARQAKIKIAVRLVDPNGSRAKGTLREYRVWRIK